MEKIYGLLIASILVLSVMPMVFAINQDFDGTQASIGVTTPLNFGGIFNGQSLPMDTAFTITPESVFTDFEPYISNIVFSVLNDIDEENIFFKYTSELEFVDSTTFLAGTTDLVNGLPTHQVKLSGVSAIEGTGVSGTIIYTISADFGA